MFIEQYLWFRKENVGLRYGGLTAGLIFLERLSSALPSSWFGLHVNGFIVFLECGEWWDVWVVGLVLDVTVVLQLDLLLGD